MLRGVATTNTILLNKCGKPGHAAPQCYAKRDKGKGKAHYSDEHNGHRKGGEKGTMNGNFKGGKAKGKGKERGQTRRAKGKDRDKTGTIRAKTKDKMSKREKGTIILQRKDVQSGEQKK